MISRDVKSVRYFNRNRRYMLGRLHGKPRKFWMTQVFECAVTGHENFRWRGATLVFINYLAGVSTGLNVDWQRLLERLSHDVALLPI